MACVLTQVLFTRSEVESEAATGSDDSDSEFELTDDDDGGVTASDNGPDSMARPSDDDDDDMRGGVCGVRVGGAGGEGCKSMTGSLPGLLD